MQHRQHHRISRAATGVQHTGGLRSWHQHDITFFSLAAWPGYSSTVHPIAASGETKHILIHTGVAASGLRSASAIQSGMHKALLPNTNYIVQFHVPAGVVCATRLQYRPDVVKTHE